MTMLEDGRRYTVLEELSTFCTLGIRFWDAATDTQIRRGLQVRAWPEMALAPVVEAARTRSDVYAFHRLPGLGRLERPRPGEAGVLGSPEGLPFVLEVVDLERRYQPAAVALSLPLPERGLFLTQLASSPPQSAPGFYLFSAPTRSRASNIAAVRGELMDELSGAAVAYALVRVEIPGESPAYSISDTRGAFAVHLPFPTLAGGLPPLEASPPGPSGPPITERTWQLTVSVFSQPGVLASLPGTDLPDVRDVFRQARADLVLADGSPPVISDRWLGTLDFAGEVILRTKEKSTLAVVPAAPPP